MANEVPERFRHLDERKNLVAVGHITMLEVAQAVRRTVPTMDDAVRLVREVTRQLGDRGWRDPEGGSERQRIFLREGEWIIPYPLLARAYGPAPEQREPVAAVSAKKDEDPRRAWYVPVDAPDGWTWDDPDFRPKDPKPEILPNGSTMRPGELAISEGPVQFTVRYGADGWHRAAGTSAVDSFTHHRYYAVKPYVLDPTARPPTPHPPAIACRADLNPRGHTLPDFARMVCESQIAERVAVRVQMPAPLPGGPLGCWQRAQGPLRELLWSGELPSTARWLVVDGYEAVARAWGDTLDDALARWREEVVRVEPLPPTANKITALPQKQEPIPPEDIPEAGDYEDPDGRFKVFSTGLITVSFTAPPPAPDEPRIDWPAPSVETIPAVAIPLPPLPAVPTAYAAAGFTRWVRLLGGFGHIHHALLREEGSGFVFVGDGILDLIDPATVTAEMDAFEAKDRAWHEPLPPALRKRHNRWEEPFGLTSYQCWDSERQARTPLQMTSGQFGRGDWTPRSLDADTARWQVIRLIRR